MRFLSDTVSNCKAGTDASGFCATNLPEISANKSSVTQVLSIVFGVAAGVALISLMIAALNYVTAFSDQDKIVRSRRAIIYSILGLVIALSAEAIVLTVVGRL